MKTATHTRSTGKRLTYSIEYSARHYDIFLGPKPLRFGQLAQGREDDVLQRAIEDIEQLQQMPED